LHCKPQRRHPLTIHELRSWKRIILPGSGKAFEAPVASEFHLTFEGPEAEAQTFITVANVRVRSNPEKLNASICFPLFTQQRTSTRVVQKSRILRFIWSLNSLCCFGANVSCRSRRVIPRPAAAA
jgi:hypothetical protein